MYRQSLAITVADIFSSPELAALSILESAAEVARLALVAAYPDVSTFRTAIGHPSDGRPAPSSTLSPLSPSRSTATASRSPARATTTAMT